MVKKTTKTTKTKAASKKAKTVAGKAKAKAKAKEPNPAAVDAWLARLPTDQRAALQRLREQIRAAAPDTVETIAWGVPIYYVGTTPLLGFNAFKDHVSLGVGSETLDTMRADLEGHDTAKGTVRFSADRPLAAALVRKIVKARIALQAAGNAM
jgi:uncharacterized protein YdhG (YjbR/CyaY superfamily)